MGTSTSKEAKEYFSDMQRHRIPFHYSGAEDDTSINLAFSKKKIEERKEWLTNHMEEKKRRTEMGLPEVNTLSISLYCLFFFFFFLGHNAIGILNFIAPWNSITMLWVKSIIISKRIKLYFFSSLFFIHGLSCWTKFFYVL